MLDGNTLFCKGCGKVSYFFDKIETCEGPRLRCGVCNYDITTQSEVDLARQMYKAETARKHRADSAKFIIAMPSLLLTAGFWGNGMFVSGLFVAGLGIFITYLINSVTKPC
jgi:hypothetical protein